jgi:tellurite resistance protein TerC
MNLVIDVSPAEWAFFAISVLGLLAVDLVYFNRKAHEIGLREAIIWSIVWTVVALWFNLVVFVVHGSEAGALFFSAYLVERALSVDNLFVFLTIFVFFKIDARYQHRVLFFGVLGALVARALFIVGGTALLHAFDWIMYIFGAVLLYTAWKIGRQSGEPVDLEHSRFVRFATGHLHVTPVLQGDRFIARLGGRWVATPLLLVLVVVEFMDVLFAFDSVPAVLGISSSTFIVYTSNAFAVLGLRALYFVVAAGMARLRFLNVGLAAILLFIGAKMMVHHWVAIPTHISLAVIGVILAVAIVASLYGRNDADRA